MSLPVDMDPTKTPLMLNPSGAPPNFHDPPTLLDAQLGVGITLIVIGATLVTFRVVTNLKVSQKLCLDDSKRSTPPLMRFSSLPADDDSPQCYASLPLWRELLIGLSATSVSHPLLTKLDAC
jgi:hypothetical protein